MWSSVTRISKALGLIAALSLAGFLAVKLAFMVVCWIGGHDILEAMFGFVAPCAFGIAIGIEAYLWLKDWQSRPIDFDTSR